MNEHTHILLNVLYNVFVLNALYNVSKLISNSVAIIITEVIKFRTAYVTKVHENCPRRGNKDPKTIKVFSVN